MNRRQVLIGAGGIGVATTGAALFSGGVGAQVEAEVEEIEDLAVTTDDGTVAWVAVGSDGNVTWEGLEAPAETFDFDVLLTITDEEGDPIADVEGGVVEDVVLASGEGRPIEGGFGRPEDSGDTGTRGTLNWDVPKPSESGEDATWLIVRNAALQDYEEGDEEYGAPEGSAAYDYVDALDADLLTVDEEDEEATYTFTKTMDVTINDENGDSVEAAVGSEFDLTVTNVPMDAEASSTGEASAGGDPDMQNESA